jgi:hypothetical protein
MIPVEILKVGLPMKEKPDVLQGTLALMVLKTLDFLCPQHGYRIARRIERICGDLLAVNQASRAFSMSKQRISYEIPASFPDTTVEFRNQAERRPTPAR